MLTLNGVYYFVPQVVIITTVLILLDMAIGKVSTSRGATPAPSS